MPIARCACASHLSAADTFVVDLAVAVHVQLADDLVDVVVSQLLAETAKHLLQFRRAHLHTSTSSL